MDLYKTRALHEPRVFLHGGQPTHSLKGAFRQACKRVGMWSQDDGLPHPV